MKFFRRALYLYIILVCGIALTGSFYAQNQPYVIIVSFDGFRWDYLNRNITPNIDKLILDGVKSESLLPVFPTKTFPNHISIITGLYPENHGIIFNEFYDRFSDLYYNTRDTVQLKNSRWYKGEAFWETAGRQGIITASYFWPGSDLDLEYRNPDYYYHYEHKRPYDERVEGVLEWLKFPFDKRPHFITMYFDLTDGVGHRFGPDSPEINQAIVSLDSTLGKLLNGLDEIQMRDSVNIILVSDHGMTEVSSQKVINIEKLLEGYEYKTSNSGPAMMIFAKKKIVSEIYSLLKQNENHYRTYLKGEIPEYFHFSNSPLISEILLVSDLGWAVVTNKDLKWMKPENYNGNHGYDNHHIDMHGIFVANGPQFKNGYKFGTLNSFDIYPLLCKIFNIIPNNKIDGKIERIEFILNQLE